MFGLGITELIISLVLLTVFIITPVALIIFFVRRGRKRNVPQNTTINLSQNNEMPKGRNDGDITDQIRKLGELRAQGLLSEEEFQHKKSELLSRL